MFLKDCNASRSNITFTLDLASSTYASGAYENICRYDVMVTETASAILFPFIYLSNHLLSAHPLISPVCTNPSIHFTNFCSCLLTVFAATLASISPAPHHRLIIPFKRSYHVIFVVFWNLPVIHASSSNSLCHLLPSFLQSLATLYSSKSKHYSFFPEFVVGLTEINMQ